MALMQSGRRRVLSAMLTTAESVPFAATVQMGIRFEQAARATTQPHQALAAAVFGVGASARRRAREERAEVARRHGFDTRPTGMPAVNWHEGGSGPTLVLINGWTASGLLWPRDWLRELESSFRVIRIDNRGTGWSRSAPAPFTMADLADDVQDVLRACQVERATVAGLSMGGMIAQEFALRHPDSVERLVLLATRPPTPSQVRSDSAPLLAAFRPPAAGVQLRAYLTELWAGYAAPDFAKARPEVIDELVAQVLQRVTPRRRVLDQGRAIASWHGANRLARLQVPTTVVHGTRDPLMPVGNGMRLARLIPNSVYLELPGVGHLLAHEAGAQVLDTLQHDATSHGAALAC
jgi:pimeloyl-ACP methyl ester carboxylesterase